MSTRPSHYPQPPFTDSNPPHSGDATEEAYAYRLSKDMQEHPEDYASPDEQGVEDEQLDFGVPRDEGERVRPGQTTFYVLGRKGELPQVVEGRQDPADAYVVHLNGSRKRFILGRNIWASRESVAMELIVRNLQAVNSAVALNAALVRWSQS